MTPVTSPTLRPALAPAIPWTRRRRGITLIEIGAAFLIASLVTIGVLKVTDSYRGTANEQNAINEITAITQKVKTLYAGAYGKYGTADFTTGAIKAGVFPTNSVVGANVVDNTFGGKISLAGTNGGQTFELSYTEVPAGSCLRLATLGLGFTQVKIGGSALIPPIDQNKAISACSSDNTAKTIVYTMY